MTALYITLNREKHMIYLYQDESGDMGFDFTKSGTSKYFSIALLIMTEQRPISSLVKKVFTSLPQATKRNNSGVLHAYYEKPITISRLLRGLATKEIQIASIRLDKRRILLSGTPHELYANIVITLINRLHMDGIINDTEDLVLIASRMNTSKILNVSFTENVVSHTHGSKFNLQIVKPNEDKCLQAVDFVSWALWQYYEKDDDTYAKLISDKIVREYVMFE
jgi:uncharacterized membrane protein